MDYSKLFSLRMIWPKYGSCCFFKNDCSEFVGSNSPITDVFVLLESGGVHSPIAGVMDYSPNCLLRYWFTCVYLTEYVCKEFCTWTCINDNLVAHIKCGRSYNVYSQDLTLFMFESVRIKKNNISLLKAKWTDWYDHIPYKNNVIIHKCKLIINKYMHSRHAFQASFAIDSDNAYH